MARLDLELTPGRGLGSFALGTSLWAILELLRQQQTTFPHISVSFDTIDPANSPILLHLRPYIDLLFTASQQRLHTVSIRLTETEPPLSLRYKSVVLISPERELRRVDVSRTFGPTYAGSTMKYPGIWFGFEEDPKSLPKRQGQGQEDKAQEVKRIVLSQHSEEASPPSTDPLERIIPCDAMDGDLLRATIRVHSGIKLRFYSSGTRRPEFEVRLQSTTVQDLISGIGPPLRVYYKDDDRLAIHGSSPTQAGYFYNYFQHGLDFLISGDDHTVQKIVVHTNIPGTALFQQYNRCPWVLEQLDDNQSTHRGTTGKDIISFRSRFEDLVGAFSSLGSAPRMKLNRAEDTDLTLLFAQTDLIGMDGVVFEVTKLGQIASFTMF